MRLLALSLCLLAVQPVHAQEPAEGDHPTSELYGTVLDHQTGEPIQAAAVYLPGLEVGFRTDSAGTFRIEDVAPGEHAVAVERLGYRSVAMRVTVTDPPTPVEFRLVPDPILLEALEVVLDRFERRRRATPTSVRAFQEDELRTAVAPSMREFLSGRAHVRVFGCPQQYLQFDCVMTRGRLAPPSVYVDDWRLMGGLDELAAYHPSEFHLVEVYARGRHIRAYTHHFMARAARIRLAPIPLTF